MAEERLIKTLGLAVFSSDALSSVAYATEEILLILVLAGAGALSLSLPIAGAIVLLLTIISISYRQVILAYPNGGGAYIVAKDNLGENAGLIAGASLLIDYTLTVAVSIAAGVAAITSAIPALQEHKVILGVSLIALVAIANLRGVRDSGKIFAIPTYSFVISLSALIVVGLVRYFMGLRVIVSTSPMETIAVQGITLFLILRAFASGCAALTGVEAISNGVQSFRKPEAKNARTTLVWMAAILGSLFVGITVLSNLLGIKPNSSETVISQLARVVFGSGIFYYVVQATTASILVVAANTSFADFPRVASIMAGDRYMPTQLKNRGDRLAFSNGIILLSAFASLLIIFFGGETHRLIPLYAVGVFTSFTLSQLGMVRHWHKDRTAGWRRKAVINAVGATTTFFVLIVIALTKFLSGAWIVIAIVPVLICVFKKINGHYVSTSRELSVDNLNFDIETLEFKLPLALRHNVVVLVSKVHIGTVQAIEYAKSLANGDPIRALHVATDRQAAKLIEHEWVKYGFGFDLEVLPSPYRDIIGPVVARLREIDKEDDNDIITVVIPEFVCRRWWQHFLHNQTSILLKARLFFWRKVVVVSVPYHLG
ncbi:MAG: APC family permease [Actinobacteria bacterium]|nr:APC family permease [Actinomycetota bacterium]